MNEAEGLELAWEHGDEPSLARWLSHSDPAQL